MTDTHPITPASPRDGFRLDAPDNPDEITAIDFYSEGQRINRSWWNPKTQEWQKNEPFPQDKITCTTCGRKNVPDWDGKGHCIKCARDLVLGTSPSADDAELDVILEAYIMNYHISGGGTTLGDGTPIKRLTKDETKQALLAWRNKSVELNTEHLRKSRDKWRSLAKESIQDV